jgi:PAS domain S-box-containing protein
MMMTDTLEDYKKYVNERLSPISDILANIASGDFSNKLEIPPKDDEFTELYVGLDFLMEDLEEHLKEREEAENELKRYQHVLEDKVKERTAELSEINKQLRNEIQEHQKDKMVLEETEAKYKLLYENMSDVIFVFNSDLVLSGITPSVQRMSGYAPEELIGRSFDDLDLLSRESLEKAFVTAEKLFQGKDIGYQEYEFKTKTGDILFAEVSNTPIFEDGDLKEFICVARDITDRKQAEDALRNSEEKYRNLVENINDVIYMINKVGNISYLSPAVTNLVGYEPSEILGRPFSDFIFQDDLSEIQENIGKIFTGEKSEGEYRIKTREDKIRWVHTSSQPIFENNEIVGFQGILSDITARKEAEEAIRKSEEMYRSLIRASPEAVTATDLDGTIIFASPQTAKLYGYDKPDELLGKNAIIFIAKGDHEKAASNLKKTLTDGNVKNVEYEMLRKDGSSFVGELSASLVKDGQGNPNSFIATVRDITERRRTEEQIKLALKEKEVLLREVHHRVKNNIQVITSMLNLHTKYIEDEKYTEMLQEIQYRVRSMALIHEKLYKSQDISVINFGDYIKELVNELFRSYGANISKIKPTIDVTEVSMDLDTGIPCGLIINELVSNSLKHGFPDGGPGEIFIRLSSNEDNEINLKVEDTGIGISDNFDIDNPSTFGLQLVNTLVAQLRGKIEFRTANSTGKSKGTEFIFKFRAPEPKSEVNKYD